MNVVVIDAFDHGYVQYADPAPIAPGVFAPRAAPALVSNYSVDSKHHVDKREQGPTRQFAAFESDEYEEYHYLLLSNAPLHDDSVQLLHEGYEKRKSRANRRYQRWLQMGTGGPALQILHKAIISDASKLARRSMPPSNKQRYRLNVTPPPSRALVYWGTRKPRYLYLQPSGTPGTATPRHLKGIAPAAIKEKISVPPGNPGLPKFAIGCTCRDFVISGMDATGAPGPAFYGCKHILFYNICAAKAETDPSVITSV